MAVPATEGCWPLSQAIVRVQGADARAFLHGQFTNAAVGPDPASARPAAWCTAQGRLLASGILWQTGDEQFEWMVSRDLVEPLTRRLRLFVLRARVSISDAPRDRVLGALGAPHVPQALHSRVPWSMAVVEQCHWIVAPMSTASRPAAWCVTREAAEKVAGEGPDAGAWTAARLASGWPCIDASTTGLFLPSTLDMDLNGTIDFRKGCYPGQEVIARSHYRGIVKRRLAYGTLAWRSDAPVDRNARDLHAAGEPDRGPVGRVIESALHAQTLHVAAEITLSDWPGTRYALGSAAGPLVDLRPLHPQAAPA